MDSQKPTQNFIDENWKEIDEWICQLPMLEPSADFTTRVMNQIDNSLYEGPGPLYQKHHTGHMLVALGVLAMIHALTIDTLQWILLRLMEIAPQIPLLESMNTIYHSVVYRLVYYVFVPYGMLVDFVTRVSVGNQMWHMAGLLNLVLLLLLFHFSLRRIIRNSREEGK